MYLIRNDDTVDIVVDEAVVIQSNGAFLLAPATGHVILKPGDSLCVQFAQQQPGVHTATIRVYYTGQTKIRREIGLTGVAGGAEIASTVSHLCFLPE